MGDHLMPSVQSNSDESARQQLSYQALRSSFRTFGVAFKNHNLRRAHLRPR
jgi:hypothetical protein